MGNNAVRVQDRAILIRVTPNDALHYPVYIYIYMGKALKHELVFLPQYGIYIDMLHQGWGRRLKTRKTPEQQYPTVGTQMESQHTCLLYHTAGISAVPRRRQTGDMSVV